MSPTTKAPTIKIDTVNYKHCVIEKEGHTVEFFVRDNMLMCCDPEAVNYYKTKFVDGVEVDAGMWIHPALEKWAADNGWYWEWENAECISLAH